MGDAARKDDEAERLERLIASNEAAANAINRLVQVLERKEEKGRVKAARVRRVPDAVPVTDRARAAAQRALARLRSEG